MNRHHPHHDVIVAGAGPVGLFLACELALAGCSVLVLEQAAQADAPMKRLPFGIRGLSAPSVEALARRGLLEQLEVPRRLKHPFGDPARMPAPPARRQIGHFAGLPFFDEDIERARWTRRLPGSLDTSMLSEMAELESVLAHRAQALGVTIRRGAAIAGVEQDAGGVTVRAGGELADGGMTYSETLRAGWLVGCDGARSTVRKLGGFDFAGTEPEFTGYSAQVDLADPERLPPGRTLTATGMFFQSQPGFLVMQEFDGGAGHGATPPTLEQVQAVLRRVSGTDVGVSALHAASTWTDRARQATRYRRGRVLLAGDAAHIHAPLGGQGLNLGLGDAMNLGWKLAATVQGRAPDGLLDTYEAERHPPGARVLDWSRAQVALMRPDPGARALSAIVRELLQTRDGATHVAGRIWGVDTRVDLGEKADAHPLAGYSVPRFELEDGRRVDDLLRDGRGLLLDFGGDAGLAGLASGYAERVDYVAGPAREQLGISALLVRPDGIVAWAGDDEGCPAGAEPALARWFTPL
ncbi:FAD-dependent oxidoreductase [Massilia forsythiae]|uniref:FAD-dependent oxidoreductase n=1 Tax=Massilia forsythiae TaxID=2728020 RepID=A0A7Z2W0C8_9BURK|nr:FAD-dependent oxidoreductase [Massilia forsythiae]QJE02120.1 FAD-dependent oxidoreductase [Massilia forsythiae]